MTTPPEWPPALPVDPPATNAPIPQPPEPPQTQAGPYPTATAPDAPLPVAVPPDGMWAPPAPPKRSVGTKLAAIAVAVTLLAGTAGAVFWVNRGDDGPDYPDAWDPRLDDLVEYVEDTRELDFLHPVYVDFLPENEFLDVVAAGRQDLTDEEKADRDESAAQTLAFFRAIGLAEGDIDLIAESENLTDAGTLAFYRFADDRIVIRGAELDLATKVTVVHELTHALEDQHFDLEAMRDVGTEPFQADAAGLIEGDATRIENEYIDDLSDAQRRRYERESEDQGDRDAIEDIPLILRLLQAGPYETGNSMVEILVATDGNDAVDAAFKNPPRNGEHLFDPASFQRLTVAREVPEFDELPDDEIIWEDDEFDPMGWLLMLGEQIDGRDAMRAALGWGGDRFRLIDDDGTVCAQIRFVGDSSDDTDEMHDALRDWQDALPHGDDIDISERDDYVEVVACDPGKRERNMTTGDSEDAYVRQLIRLEVISDALTDDEIDADLEAATCYADGIATEWTQRDFDAEETSRKAQRVAGELFEECFGPPEDS